VFSVILHVFYAVNFAGSRRRVNIFIIYLAKCRNAVFEYFAYICGQVVPPGQVGDDFSRNSKLKVSLIGFTDVYKFTGNTEGGAQLGAVYLISRHPARHRRFCPPADFGKTVKA
jgi:hypothetical protein